MADTEGTLNGYVYDGYTVEDEAAGVKITNNATGGWTRLDPSTLRVVGQSAPSGCGVLPKHVCTLVMSTLGRAV